MGPLQEPESGMGTINADEEFTGFSMGSVVGKLTDAAKTALLTPVPTGGKRCHFL
jgi:acetyl-CoA carboxylase beta subunit